MLQQMAGEQSMTPGTVADEGRSAAQGVSGRAQDAAGTVRGSAANG